MTLLESIENLTWYNFLNKLKSILKELFGKDRPYKVVTANLAISGTTPSMTELENTLGLVEISRDSEGNFLINSDGLFTEGKTWLCISNRDFTYYNDFGQNDANGLFITVKERGDDSDSDTGLQNTSIEIRVYN